MAGRALPVKINCGLALATPAGRQAALAEHVIIISVDGMMPVYYREPDRFCLKIAVLRELGGAGSSFAGAEGVFPTVTYPNHTSIVTGVPPIEHGIEGNTPLDPFNETNGVAALALAAILRPVRRLMSEADGSMTTAAMTKNPTRESA